MQHGTTLRNIVIVGSGNVAEALAGAVSGTEGLSLRQIFARNAERGRALAAMTGTVWTADPGQLAVADLYLVAVSDQAVAQATAALDIPEEAVVAHTAGSVSLETLDRFRRRAVFYPLQTFTAGRKVDFGRIPLFVEASDEATRTAVEQFARRLSERVYPTDSELRARLHLAGVFACNFANAMYTAAGRTLADAGLPFEVLGPLIAETAAKALSAGDPAAVQTGPAVRGDRPTVERHRKMLAGDEELVKIYETMSRYIWKTSKKR